MLLSRSDVSAYAEFSPGKHPGRMVEIFPVTFIGCMQISIATSPHPVSAFLQNKNRIDFSAKMRISLPPSCFPVFVRSFRDAHRRHHSNCDLKVRKERTEDGTRVFSLKHPRFRDAFVFTGVYKGMPFWICSKFSEYGFIKCAY